jgi:hypothetical protein
MTRMTNARIAGFTFLFYLAVGLSSLAVPRTASTSALFQMLTSFSAMLLGVTLYSITSRQDRDIAMLGLVSRIVEAVPGEGTIYAAVGCLLFFWLFLRGRMIPLALAWFGVVSSSLMVMFLPLQILGFFGGPGSWQSPVTWVMAFPLLLFEVTLGLWLIIKGVAEPGAQQNHEIAPEARANGRGIDAQQAHLWKGGQ